MAEPMIHIAGIALVFENRYMRQRCGWCGTVLIDEDMTLVAVVQGTEQVGVPFWEPYALIEVDGGMSSVIEPTIEAESMKMPEASCMKLDPAITA
jgi:hypothetical protein